VQNHGTSRSRPVSICEPVASAAIAGVLGTSPCTSASWLPSAGNHGARRPVAANGRCAAPTSPEFIAAIAELEDGDAVLDEHQRTLQPDWTHDEVYSGKWPADRLDDHREHLDLDEPS